MVAITLLCLSLALYMLPFPSITGWLIIGIGAASLFIAASGLGTALKIHRSYLFAISLLILAWLVLSGMVLHKQGHYVHVFPETATLIPTATATLTPTITLVPTKAPPATPTAVITPTPSGNATIQRIQVNVRLGPSTKDNIVAVLNMNDQVAIYGRTADGQWLLVATSTGTSGWISASLVTVDKPMDNFKVVTPAAK
jgi:hypothetical protein